MIAENAQVVGFEGNDIWVETQRKTACGQCAANKGCGTAVLSKVLGNKRSRDCMCYRKEFRTYFL